MSKNLLLWTASIENGQEMEDKVEKPVLTSVTGGGKQEDTEPILKRQVSIDKGENNTPTDTEGLKFWTGNCLPNKKHWG